MNSTKIQDKELTCIDCGKIFIFTVAEQNIYNEKGYTHEPKRCLKDRKNRKNSRLSGQVSYKITCRNCGDTDTVSFEPKEGRQVLCGICFAKSRN